MSRSAYACRRCGKNQRVRPRIILLGLAGCLMVGMFAVASASALLGPTHVAESAAPVARSPRAGAGAGTGAGAGAHLAGTAPTPEITAADLWMAYSRDPAGSDRTFRDRSLQVTGAIRSVDRDFEGHLVARLNTGDAFETVNATMATRDDPALVGVSKGRTVSLLCVGHGLLMGAPLLGGCFVR